MGVVGQWTGRHATALRGALRLTTEAYSEHLGVAPRTVSYWAANPDRVCRPAMQQVLDTALARADHAVRERFHVAVGVPVEIPTETWEFADLLTRCAITTTGLNALETAIHECAGRYPATGPGAVLASNERQMERLGEVLRHPLPVAIRRRSVRLLGLLAGIVGHQHFDLGDVPRARRLFDLGRLASIEAEDPDLEAWLLATASIVAYFDGQNARAVALLTEAAALATRHSTPRRQAWIAAMRGRALAAAGKAADTHRALAEAQRLLGTVLDQPNGNDFFDLARLDGMTGAAMTKIGDTPRAAQALGRALHSRASTDGKGRALLTLDLASCLLTAGEYEEAARLVGTALDIAGVNFVRPILTRTIQVRSSFRPDQTPRVVAELDQRIRAAASQFQMAT
ncbi:MAG TPA: hypothetical protein VGR21_08645 [Cryptosporangiaceae bacterium]|nr:hypothetical protein [Cryptosporangiaceae bacterium]